MTCSHCEARVKQALEAVDGVAGAAVQAQDYPCRAAQDEPERN